MVARRESSLSFQKDRSTLITGGKRGVGSAFVILVTSEIGDTEIKRDIYDLEVKGLHFSCSSLRPFFYCLFGDFGFGFALLVSS